MERGESFRVLVVVPAFNEEESVAGVVEELRKRNPLWDILAVNDCSGDATGQRAREAGARVVDLPRNLGIGGAVQTGFLYAFRHGYHGVVQCDGDGQHPASEVASILESLQDGVADVVVGSRFLRKEGEGFLSTPFRHLGISLLAAFLGKLCGRRVSDPTSGLRAYNRRSFMFLSRYYPRDYPEPEALLLLHRHGFSVREKGVVMRERRGGRSSLGGWVPLVYMAKVLLSLGAETLRPLRTRR
jgi:glycosyltransferase involved in cell wall biosynthesis